MMAPLNIEWNAISDQDLMELTAEACRRLMSRRPFREPLAVEDAQKRTIGLLVPLPTSTTEVSAEFLAEMNRRIDDPASRFLTLDEFLDELDQVPSASGVS